MLPSDVIQLLNEAVARERRDRFPDLDVWFPIDTRLSVYRDDGEHWAIVVELLEFKQTLIGHECCTTEVLCYGDLPCPSADFGRSELHVTGDGPSGPLFDPNDVLQQIVSPTARDMTIRGKVVPITTDPAQYAAAGIQLKLSSNSTPLWLVLEEAFAEDGFSLGQPPRIFGYELLRLIAPRYRRLFFATEAEIEERLGTSMPLLLRLNEWQHPDRGKGETPAYSESFQLIAEVIARDDPSLYQPTEPPNTHWSNYPMAGEV